MHPVKTKGSSFYYRARIPSLRQGVCQCLGSADGHLQDVRRPSPLLNLLLARLPERLLPYLFVYGLGRFFTQRAFSNPDRDKHTDVRLDVAMRKMWGEQAWQMVNDAV